MIAGDKWVTEILNGVAIVIESQPRQSSGRCDKWRDFIFAQIYVESLCAFRNYRIVVVVIKCYTNKLRDVSA